MKKVLLITPDFNPEDAKVKDFGSRLRLIGMNILDSKAFMVPLGLATVAALTPDDVEVDIWDEAVHGLVSDSTDLKKDYDLVGVTGYIAHIRRIRELGQIFRRRGIPVAVGGPAVSASPEHYRDYFDILFIGEAEYTWPRFIADWKAGSYRSEYRQVSKVDMAYSPPPRWDKVAADIRHYVVGGVQTTRGCPFDCEFCDVIYIYGRQARHKSIDRILEEVCALERMGVKNIFLCDDNFIGNPGYAKALLRELVSLNRSFRHPVSLFTQITLNVAKDDEMLELLADAHFVGLFIGIETPNIESLIETNKPQNYKTDIVADLKKIQSYGLIIQGGMIVGFDHDDTTIFESQFEFLQDVGIVNPIINILKAPQGTKLWVRLHKEGRVVLDPKSTISSDWSADDSNALTNIIPKLMTRAELMSGYGGLVQRVRDWHNFEVRVKRMISLVRRRPNIKKKRRHLKPVLRFLKFVLFTMDREARGATIRLLFYTLRRAPFMIGLVMVVISRQYAEAAQVPFLLETIDEQIRLETAKGMKLQREQTVFFVPDGFKKPYKAIFPELYKRVYQGLADKSRTHDALVEVTYDFLTRWGPSFEQFEEYHPPFLYEICDRTIAKENNNLQNGAGENAEVGEVPAEMVGLTEAKATIRLRQLADEVLRNVEQELRGFRPQPPGLELESAVTG